MKYLIINADDFGLDASVTNAIADCFSRGIISQTTLMVNMSDADNAVRVCKENGFYDKVGLHLNLTEGLPLTSAMRDCNVFCGEGGRYDGRCVTNKRFFVPYPKSICDILAGEIRAQIEKFLSYGLPLRHCDSHHHAHTRLPIARILLPLLSEYGFISVRRPYCLNFKPNIHNALRIVRNGMFVSLVRRSKIFTARYFGDIRDFKAVGADLREGMAELMVHPQCLDHCIMDGRHSEVRMSDVYDIVKRQGWELASYRDLTD